MVNSCKRQDWKLNEYEDILDEKNLYWKEEIHNTKSKKYLNYRKWNQKREGIPLHFTKNDIKKIKARMNKKLGQKIVQKIWPKDQFYDIDTLKKKFGLKTEAEWYEALDELGDEDINKILKL